MSDPTTHTALTPSHVEAITAYLEGVGVDHELIEHQPTMTAAAEAGATHRSPDQVAKTIVLHDGRAYAIAAIPASRRLDLSKLRHLLGATRGLQLATEPQIARDFPALEVGAVPPFGPMVPAAEVIDRSLLDHERILCPAGDHRHSVLVDPHEVIRITSARVADICQD
jgi:Ala-tRNA(Pro) deacylase